MKLGCGFGIIEGRNVGSDDLTKKYKAVHQGGIMAAVAEEPISKQELKCIIVQEKEVSAILRERLVDSESKLRRATNNCTILQEEAVSKERICNDLRKTISERPNFVKTIHDLNENLRSSQIEYADLVKRHCRLRARRARKYQIEVQSSKRRRILFGRIRHVWKYRSFDWLGPREFYFLVGVCY